MLADRSLQTIRIFRCGCLALLFFSLAGISPLSAQELNAVVKVNSTGVQSANRSLFNSLEESLWTFINGRRWSDRPVRADERISCSFTLVITEAIPSGSFKGELHVQSHRPVENSNYTSPMLNIRDRELEFDYTEHQPLQFDPNFMQGNLTAAVAYYAYLILALDFDSHSQWCGTSCFRNMEQIAANAQSYGWKGWERRNQRNRSAIAAAFNDGALGEYRQMWFDYHREGLDMTDRNGNPGYEKIVPSIRFLSALQSKRPTSVLIKLFGDTKLEEMVNLLSKAEPSEKKQAHEALLKLYPTRNTELGRLR